MAPLLTRLGSGRGGFGFGRRATSPIYAITPSTSSVNEGSSVTFNVSTINVQSGTTLYWTVNSVSGTVNASDFDEGVSGSFVVTSNAGSVVLNVTNDATTEGSESFQLQVRTGSTSGPIVATSSTVTIGDTSLTPTYSVSPSTSSVNEGSSVTFTTTTTNVSDGTTLYWTLSTISGTINSSDFSGGVTSGSFTITSNSGSVVLTLANDVTTEGSESFQFQVRTGSTGGTVVATSTTVTINDTSLAFSATGGTVIDSGGYRIHVFTSPGSFVVSGAPSNVEYFVLAGGGGGGGRHAGGGGAGGFRTGTGLPATPGTYPITVGAGGAGALDSGNGTPTTTASSGSNSSAFTITSSAGGAGGGAVSVTGSPGGSGGGGQGGGSGGSGNQPPVAPPQGNPGGSGAGSAPVYGGGGGGGASSSGNNGSPTTAGSGGNGSPISWLPASYGTPGPAPGRYFAGGGGGACYFGTAGASGGFGGGGNGSTGGADPGDPGLANTGGGGGGGGGNPDTSQGGSGGSGIVAIRYLL